MSTIDYACPACQTVVTVPERAGGKPLPCPQCGVAAVVPVSLPLTTEEFSSPTRERIPDEPWYFAMACFYAWLLVMAGFIAVVVVPGFMLALATKNPGGWALPMVFLGFICYCLPIALAFFFSAALIFLFVDVARSLRAIRRQTRNR